MDILVRKATIDQLKNELLPMLFMSLDSSTPQIQVSIMYMVVYGIFLEIFIVKEIFERD